MRYASYKLRGLRITSKQAQHNDTAKKSTWRTLGCCANARVVCSRRDGSTVTQCLFLPEGMHSTPFYSVNQSKVEHIRKAYLHDHALTRTERSQLQDRADSVHLDRSVNSIQPGTEISQQGPHKNLHNSIYSFQQRVEVHQCSKQRLESHFSAPTCAHEGCATHNQRR